MSLQQMIKRKMEINALNESNMKGGQAGSIDPNRNQVTGLTYWDGAHELRTNTLYEDELGNKFHYKEVKEDSTQTTSDVKFPTDVNIVKNADGKECMLQRQYLKETDSPYDIDKIKESSEYSREEDSKMNETDDIINGIKENNMGNEPIISDEDEAKLKESFEILGDAGFVVDKYRERVTNPTPDREQNNFGINHLTVEVDGKELSIYEAEEYADLVKKVVEATSEEISKKVDETTIENNKSQGE